MDFITPILGAILPIINKLIPDPKAQIEFQLKLQEILAAEQAKLIEAQQAVMVADASQDDNYTKRARPSVVYWSMGFATFIAIAGLFGHAQPLLDALKQIPTELWSLMTVGIGAFGISRGVEKGIGAALGKSK